MWMPLLLTINSGASVIFFDDRSRDQREKMKIPRIYTTSPRFKDFRLLTRVQSYVI